MVKVRLTRVGTKNAPIYRVVVMDSRNKRDGEYIENLGTYNPVSHQFVNFNEERINYWLSQGAQLTDSVKKLQKMHQKQKSA